MNKPRYAFDPDYKVPPGETLQEVMDHMEIVEIQGLSTQVTKGLLEGTQEITSEIAQMLESVTKIPARLWINLEINYRK